MMPWEARVVRERRDVEERERVERRRVNERGVVEARRRELLKVLLDGDGGSGVHGVRVDG